MPQKRRRRPQSLRNKVPGARDRRYGRIKFEGLGSRTRVAQVTKNPSRIRQFPGLSAKRGKRFTIPSDKFTYLAGVKKPRQLGVPTSLGDNVIIIMDFKPSATLKKLINDQMGNITPAHRRRGRQRIAANNVIQIKNDLIMVAQSYFKRIRILMAEKINEIVPKFTGRLRMGMISSLTKSIKGLKTMPYIFKLNTLDTFGQPIFYSNPVNNMPTEWLAHPPNSPDFRMHKGTMKPLFDPGAETGWYEKVVDYGRDIARQSIGVLRLEIIKLYGISQLTELIYQNLLSNTKFK